jgi:hypothetical protein
MYMTVEEMGISLGLWAAIYTFALVFAMYQRQNGTKFPTPIWLGLEYLLLIFRYFSCGEGIGHVRVNPV